MSQFQFKLLYQRYPTPSMWNNCHGTVHVSSFIQRKNIKRHFMTKQGSPSSRGELSKIRLYVKTCERTRERHSKVNEIS